jgi:hypothetical protein
MGIISFTYPKTPKSIGGFEIDVILSESYGFSNSVTDIPVEDGSNVNDHVVSESPDISIQAFIGRAKYEVWDGDIPETIDELPADDPKARIKQAYLELRRLMDDKQPLTVVLGLDTFENMVITSFEISRDVQTGADLPFSMSFKQVRIIQSETTTVNSSRGGGDQTAGTANGGVVGTQATPPKSNKMHLEWKQTLQMGGCTRDEYLQVCNRNGWVP